MISRYVLARAYDKLEAADRDPEAAQRRVYERLRDALAGTLVGEVQRPGVWRGLEFFRGHLVPTTYQQYRGLVEMAMQTESVAGMFEKKATRAFGHTTSGHKYIPYTRAHVDAFQAFQLAVGAQAVFGRGLSALATGRSFMLQGNLETWRTQTDVLAGYSSAVMAEHTPWLLKRRMAPSLDVLRTEDAAKRLEKLTAALIARKPQVLMGIPEIAIGTLRAMLAGPRAAEVRDVLRGVSVYGWSGTALGPYRDFLAAHLAKGCVFFDAVSATEAPIGIQAEIFGLYRLALDQALYTFTPVGDPEQRLFAWELREGQDYDVLVSSFAGLIGYALGDRVRVASQKPLRFVLLPRQIDVEATWRRLGPGVTDFKAFFDTAEKKVVLWVESSSPIQAAAVRELALALGAARVEVRQVAAGALSRAAMRMSALGMPKLPWAHERPELQKLLERHVS